MEQTGQIRKMTSEIGEPIQYFLPMGEEEIAMNAFIGKEISFQYDGLITCILCDRKTKKSFNQGFCYPCMLNAPEASESPGRPDRHWWRVRKRSYPVQNPAQRNG